MLSDRSTGKRTSIRKKYRSPANTAGSNFIPDVVNTPQDGLVRVDVVVLSDARQ
jgi:hypothetical protein